MNICATFVNQFRVMDGFLNGGEPLLARTIPKDLVDAAVYLKSAVGEKPVEFISTPEMVNVFGSAKEYGFEATDLFFQTVHACFSKHYALVLRPEVLMHLIVGEVAATVNKYPESYRKLFTDSSEKKLIEVQHDGLVLGDPQSPWGQAIELFRPKLVEAVPAGIMEHLLPAFSTATPESSVAGLVAFMDAASKFYDYRMHTLCGIPEVRMAGEPEDYRKILRAASALSEVFDRHLHMYFQKLLPVLKKICEQVEGEPMDNGFWSSIYKHDSASGTDTFNGWMTTFVNYIQNGRYGVISKSDFEWDGSDRSPSWRQPGIDAGSLPSHVSLAKLQWHYLGAVKPMLLASGIFGLAERDGAVEPRLAYAVLHDV